MQILDSTLREGEQQYGVFFPISLKLQLAVELIKVVDFFEISSPLVAPSYQQASEELARIVPSDQLVVHCMLDEDYVYSAKELGAQWVGLFVSIRSDFHLPRFGRTLTDTYVVIHRLLQLCKKLGMHVRLTCEDASRTPLNELIKFYRTAIDAGVARIGFADTTGCLTPDQLYTYLISLKSARIPFSKLHVHFHNDCGYANKNFTIAAKFGIGCIDGTITGIGERVGVTQTEYLTSELSRPNRSAIEVARDLVLKNVISKSASELRFAHKAGIHIDGVIKCPATYEWTTPESLGLNRLIVLSKLSGRSAIQFYLSKIKKRQDHDLPDIDAIFQKLKEQDLLEIATEDSFEFFLKQIMEEE